ncbi:MAG: sulfotransferase [Bacteroidetes bacterium]|nr:sulfotransferase [Bacteroidota bacterium]
MINKSERKTPIFFILGRPRTGTTLLLKLFDAHPNVMIPWESQYIVNLYPRYGKLTSWTKNDLEDFYNDLEATWQFKFWDLDHVKLKEDLLALEGEISYPEICKWIHQQSRSMYPKKEIEWIGDKNPGYTIYVDRLKKIFPEAKFIFINRDYRDNFVSIRNVDFELPVVSITTYKWKYFYKKALKAKERFPDDVLLLRYEDLAAEPEKYFGNVCVFLGLDSVPEVFEFHRKKEEAEALLRTERSKIHHASLMNPINTGRIRLWEKKMTEKEIRMADLVAGRYAEKAGYERRFQRSGLLTWLQSLPGVFYARFIYCITPIVDKLPYKLRAQVLNKGPLVLVKLFSGFFKMRSSGHWILYSVFCILYLQ